MKTNNMTGKFAWRFIAGFATVLAWAASAAAQAVVVVGCALDAHTRIGAAKSAEIDLNELTLTTFDYPGSSTWTGAEAINSEGDIVGGYDYNYPAGHGYLRTNDGTFSSIDPPGAVFNTADGINDQGDIVGWYRTVDNKRHIYVLSHGQFTSFDVGDGSISTIRPQDSTTASGINSAGDIVGNLTLQGHTYGYRKSGGNITTIDYPGTKRTSALKINDHGDIVGNYTLSAGHGYLFKNGTYSSIDYPGAAVTFALGINNDGDIVGAYIIAGVVHGYVLSNGHFTSYDVQGATYTALADINDEGSIVGRYVSGGITHALLLSDQGQQGQQGQQ